MERKTIKRITASVLLVSVIASVTGCLKPTGRLACHMTQKETESVSETEFRLLDKPWEQYARDKDKKYDYLNDKVCLGKEYGALVYGKPCFVNMLPEGYDGGKTC